MLHLWEKSKPIDGHEEVFLARYHQALKWARHFSANRPWQAGDLVQEAFLQFMALRPDLDQIRDLDAFLYSIVRNVNRSMLYRHLRVRQIPLSAIDFDSAEEGLMLADQEVVQSVIDDLVAVCDFACARKQVSKTGSLLILRFFHGYSVLETAALMGVTRGALNERLRHARREAREYLSQRGAEASGNVVPLRAPRSGDRHGNQAEDIPGRESTHLGQHDAIDSLRSRIFSSAQGECISPADLKTIYAPSVEKTGRQQPVDHLILAHIVSCRGCLNMAASCLGLVSIDNHKPPAASSGSASGGSASEDLTRQWHRRFENLIEQTPEEIHIAVNGLPLASQPVAAGRCDLAIGVPIQERIEFVEVFSERDVRLLMLPVLAVPPEGECQQTCHVDFSDGRTLSVGLAFDHPWPIVQVQYGELEPEQVESGLNEQAVGVTTTQPNERSFSWFNPFELLVRDSVFSGPRLWSGAVAVAMIVVLLFVQTRDTMASAAVLVSRAEEWERKVAPVGTVLHRTFDFVEKPKGSLPPRHRRVDVWRKANFGLKLSQMTDESGRLIQTAKVKGTLPVLTQATAWLFEPAPDSYRALAGHLDSSRVSYTPHTIELATPTVRLTLNRSDYSPIGEVIDTGDSKFEFQATASESIPELQSPLAVADVPVAPLRHIREIRAAEPQPVSLTETDLKQAELAAVVALHELNGDLGEDLRIRRSANSVEVAGIVDSEERKEALTNRLRRIANLRISLLSSEDISSRNGIAAMPSAPPATGNDQPPVLAEWLQEQFPDAVARSGYVSQLVEISRLCLRRAFALRQLSEHYTDAPPPEAQRIAQDHIQALAAQWAELEKLVAPWMPSGEGLSGDSPGGAPKPVAGGNITSRNEISSLFTDMKTFDQDVGVLFTEHAAHDSNSEPSHFQPNLQEVQRLHDSIATAVAQLSQK
jgi:RNA polymerase sigma factor (sigma-70 family)